MNSPTRAHMVHAACSFLYISIYFVSSLNSLGKVSAQKPFIQPVWFCMHILKLNLCPTIKTRVFTCFFKILSSCIASSTLAVETVSQHPFSKPYGQLFPSAQVLYAKKLLVSQTVWLLAYHHCQLGFRYLDLYNKKQLNLLSKPVKLCSLQVMCLVGMSCDCSTATWMNVWLSQRLAVKMSSSALNLSPICWTYRLHLL